MSNISFDNYRIRSSDLFHHPRGVNPVHVLAGGLRLARYGPIRGGWPLLKPGHDHCIDALRYAVEEIWNKSGGRIAEWSASDLGL